ncbi:MAG: dockerin type I repeat-containing protein [Verrucomicrobiota bacterium]
MMRILLILSVVAVIASPLWVSSNDSRSGQQRSEISQAVHAADSDGVASSSANYSIPSELIGSGGAFAQSVNYSMYVSGIGEFGAGGSASITSADYRDYIGYVGQLGRLDGPITAGSRKMHGAAGIFDIGLPFGGPVGIECRTGGASNNYQLVATFNEQVTLNSASVVSGNGNIPPGGASATGNQITVNLTGVANAQTIVVTLFGVSDGPNTSDVSVAMAMLIGDTNANGAVNSADVAQTKSRIGQTLDATNFRSDVNANGAINASDVALIKSNIGTAHH